MKTDLNYLPLHKQTELAQLTALIKETIPAEIIILFGSYARGDWVEVWHDDERQHVRYQSDYDLLVVVETRSESQQSKFEHDIEVKIEQLRDQTIKTPVSIIVHDIEFINRRLKKAQYFFTDIKQEGVLLFDSGKYQLSEAKELKPEERKRLAQEDFEYWFKNADEFFIDFTNAFNRGSYPKAAFELHQVTERLYTGILLVFTRYKPNTHDLEDLRSLANSVDNRLVKAFPFATLEDRKLFKLLRKAYVDARYNPSFRITAEELEQLALRVKELKIIGELICQEKINGY